MALASLFNVPESEEELSAFSFANADQHVSIVNRIFARRGLLLPTYILDPIPLSDTSDWLRLHQQAHFAFTAVLGIAGVDLTDVDFKNKEQLASWSRLHGEEHLLAASMLGFG